MVVSDEPGLYIEGEYGIRLENLLVCHEKETTDFGRFMNWEILTLAPFEREAVEDELMEEGDRKLLNDYHRRVREKLFPLMKTREEKEWLWEATEAI